MLCYQIRPPVEEGGGGALHPCPLREGSSATCLFCFCSDVFANSMLMVLLHSKAKLQRQSSIISVPLAGGKVVELDGVAGIRDMNQMSKSHKKETFAHLESLQAQIASMMSALQAQ